MNYKRQNPQKNVLMFFSGRRNGGQKKLGCIFRLYWNFRTIFFVQFTRAFLAISNMIRFLGLYKDNILLLTDLISKLGNKYNYCKTSLQLCFTALLQGCHIININYHNRF